MPAPLWELHIRPMFNLQDWDHMKARFDLTDVNSVWQFRQGILGRVRSPDPMPPKTEGGPWPPEWIALFERWITAGEQDFGGKPPRLTVGTGTSYALAAGFGRWRLSGNTTLPSADSKAWLHLVSISNTSQTLTLYLDTPPNPAGGSVAQPLLTFINPTPTLQEVIVVDANGENSLATPGRRHLSGQEAMPCGAPAEFH